MAAVIPTDASLRRTASTRLLPQTQCTRCGYPDCHAYAQAIADGERRHQPLPARRCRKASSGWPR